MSCVEEVVYQVVTPGEPEQNGRCCLNGISSEMAPIVAAGTAVSVDGSAIDSEVGPLVAGGLGPDVSGETRKKITSDAH